MYSLYPAQTKDPGFRPHLHRGRSGEAGGAQTRSFKWDPRNPVKGSPKQAWNDHSKGGRLEMPKIQATFSWSRLDVEGLRFAALGFRPPLVSGVLRTMCKYAPARNL